MLSSVATWLFGCSHRRTSFPMTVRNPSSDNRRDGAETYVVCLDCGQHFAYDWAAMRITRAKQNRAAVGTNHSESGRRVERAFEGSHRLVDRLVHHT